MSSKRQMLLLFFVGCVEIDVYICGVKSIYFNSLKNEKREQDFDGSLAAGDHGGMQQ